MTYLFFGVKVSQLACVIMTKLCSPYQTCIILLMVGAGSLITITLKWSDELLSRNSIGEMVPFSHPFLQSTFMFLGELFCIVVFCMQKIWKRSHQKVVLNISKSIGKYPVFDLYFSLSQFKNL